MRRRRFDTFLQLLETVPKPATLLDVGGTPGYWESMGFVDPSVSITTLNLTVQPNSTMRQVSGDARSMPQFDDDEFDVVYSNSVIEHTGSRADQEAFAREVRRVGTRYFVQTPNYWFPLEPHFLLPGFQFLPVRSRALILSRFDLGHIRRKPTHSAAEDAVRSIKLLTARDLRALFPGADLLRERFLGLTKSLMAIGGW